MEKRKTPQERYDEKNIVRVSLKLNRKTDADLLDALNASDNKQGLIKQALRSYLKGVTSTAE